MLNYYFSIQAGSARPLPRRSHKIVNEDTTDAVCNEIGIISDSKVETIDHESTDDVNFVATRVESSKPGYYKLIHGINI